MSKTIEQIAADMIDPSNWVEHRNGWIIIKYQWMNTRTREDYPLDKFQDPKDLLGFIYHLSSKTWFHMSHARYLIELVCKLKGWNPL